MITVEASQLPLYYINTVGIVDVTNVEIRGSDGTNVASMSSNGLYSFIPVRIDTGLGREDRLTLIRRTPPSNSKINAQDDTVVLNIHPTNQTKLIADNSILQNDIYTPPQAQNTGIVTVDPGEAASFIGIDNRPTVPPNFVVTNVGFEYRVSDYEGVLSNGANILIIVTSFGPHDEDEIPVIPSIPLGQTTQMIPLNLINDTILRITSAVEYIGSGLMIRVYLSSDPQNPIFETDAANFFEQRAVNPLYGDINMTFNVETEDTINIIYAYEDYSYVVSRAFVAMNTVTPPEPPAPRPPPYIPRKKSTPAPIPPPVPPVTRSAFATFIMNNLGTIIAAGAVFGFVFLLLLGII